MVFNKMPYEQRSKALDYTHYNEED